MRSIPSTCLYSPECVEGEFFEVRPNGVLGSSHRPGPTPLSFSIRVREDSCALAKHLCSLRLVRRLPVTRSLRPTQLAHGPTHGGDGNPDSLLALPQLAVAL